MSNPLQILNDYWGYDEFRPLQKEIVDSVIAGNDTLALLPTGGGKSICFQVPALMQDGICIVVSPLIALMKDQVKNLNDRGIKAVAITSELDRSQIDALFDRCIYEDMKFLYLSPERLNTQLAKVRIEQMSVSLVAVDEAHCISEWGYDFRPSYLDIAQIRSILPTTPMIALTASATPPVIKDIVKKLEFRKGYEIFRKSFERDNLSYQVEWTENKFNRILELISGVDGSGIIYMRNRKGTERVSRELQERGASIDFYHAGLNSELRSEKQEAWMVGKTKVIAATNAFGMGIDKSDVRIVIHLDIPDTLENYYQECGRAGRDGLSSAAHALITERNIEFYRKRMTENFPDKDSIKAVYNSLGSFFQLAVGSGKDESFEFNITAFCEQFGFRPKLVASSLKFLELQDYLQVIEHSNAYSSVFIQSSHDRIRNLKETNEKVRPLIEALLRSYGRLFEEETNISEWTLAKRCNWPIQKVKKMLEWMSASEYIDYRPSSGYPSIKYTDERLAPGNVRIDNEHYDIRKKVMREKLESTTHYFRSESKCRSRMLLEYFGEKGVSNCGKCDHCLDI